MPDAWYRRILGEFDGRRLDDEGTLTEMAAADEQNELLLDPHTAVGVHAARAFEGGAVPVVTLATADPAKFPDAVERATGRRPRLPADLAELLERREHYEVMDRDLATLGRRLRSLGR